MNRIRNSTDEPAITIAVRIRPLFVNRQREAIEDISEELEVPDNENVQCVLKALDDKVLCFDPSSGGNLLGGGKSRRGRDIRYGFDYVLDESATQFEVYERTARPLIEWILNGYNATVFAYGVRNDSCFERRGPNGNVGYWRWQNAHDAWKSRPTRSNGFDYAGTF